MFGIKNFLFKSGAPAHLSEEMRASVELWRNSPAPELDDAHFHLRYVVIDIATTGTHPENDKLLSIAATGVQQAGLVRPDDAFYLDFAAIGDDATALDQQLMAFLHFLAKAPLVTFHVPYVGGFLQQLYKVRLGVDFEPKWVDLAWLLPAMFEEKSHSLQPLDHWLDLFGFAAGSGRRGAMDNTLLLARVFQMLLVRATGKGIVTAARLVEESHASSFLRRTH